MAIQPIPDSGSEDLDEGSIEALYQELKKHHMTWDFKGIYWLEVGRGYYSCNSKEHLVRECLKQLITKS